MIAKLYFWLQNWENSQISWLQRLVVLESFFYWDFTLFLSIASLLKIIEYFMLRLMIAIMSSDWHILIDWLMINMYVFIPDSYCIEMSVLAWLFSKDIKGSLCLINMNSFNNQKYDCLKMIAFFNLHVDYKHPKITYLKTNLFLWLHLNKKNIMIALIAMIANLCARLIDCHSFSMIAASDWWNRDCYRFRGPGPEHLPLEEWQLLALSPVKVLIALY